MKKQLKTVDVYIQLRALSRDHGFPFCPKYDEPPEWTTKLYKLVGSPIEKIFMGALTTNDMNACVSVLDVVENAGPCDRALIQNVFKMACARLLSADALAASKLKARYDKETVLNVDIDRMNALLDTTTLDADAASSLCLRLMDYAAHFKLEVNKSVLRAFLAPAMMKQNAGLTLRTLGALRRVSLSEEQRTFAWDMCSPRIMDLQGNQQMSRSGKAARHLVSAGLATHAAAQDAKLVSDAVLTLLHFGRPPMLYSKQPLAPLFTIAERRFVIFELLQLLHDLSRPAAAPLPISWLFFLGVEDDGVFAFTLVKLPVSDAVTLFFTVFDDIAAVRTSEHTRIGELLLDAPRLVLMRRVVSLEPNDVASASRLLHNALAERVPASVLDELLSAMEPLGVAVVLEGVKSEGVECAALYRSVALACALNWALHVHIVAAE